MHSSVFFCLLCGVHTNADAARPAHQCILQGDRTRQLARVGTVGSALCPPQTLPARSSRPAANAAAEVDWRRPEYGPTVPFALSPKQQQEAWGDQPPTLDGLAEGCGSVFFSATVCEHSFRFFFVFSVPRVQPNPIAQWPTQTILNPSSFSCSCAHIFFYESLGPAHSSERHSLTNTEGITPPFFSSPSITRQRATQYCYATGRPRVRRLPTSPPPMAATEEAPEPWLAGTSRLGGGRGGGCGGTVQPILSGDT